MSDQNSVPTPEELTRRYGDPDPSSRIHKAIDWPSNDVVSQTEQPVDGHTVRKSVIKRLEDWMKRAVRK